MSLSVPLTLVLFVFFFNDTATTEIYTLSLHDALPILPSPQLPWPPRSCWPRYRIPRHSTGCSVTACSVTACSVTGCSGTRSEEHTSELQSPCNLVCRLLLEKNNSNQRFSRCLDSQLTH